MCLYIAYCSISLKNNNFISNDIYTLIKKNISRFNKKFKTRSFLELKDKSILVAYNDCENKILIYNFFINLCDNKKFKNITIKIKYNEFCEELLLLTSGNEIIINYSKKNSFQYKKGENVFISTDNLIKNNFKIELEDIVNRFKNDVKLKLAVNLMLLENGINNNNLNLIIYNLDHLITKWKLLYNF